MMEGEGEGDSEGVWKGAMREGVRQHEKGEARVKE